MKVKLPRGVLPVPTYLLSVLPEAVSWDAGHVLVTLLEDPRTRKGQKEAGRPPLCGDWGSHQKHVQVPGPRLVGRLWEMAP